MLGKKISTHLLKPTIFGLILGLFGCGNRNISTIYNQRNSTIINSNLPIVVATNSVICDLTKQVAGNTINLICLIPPGMNPLTYKPIPEDSRVIESADLVLYHGYNFEPSLMKIIKSTTNTNSYPKIAVGQSAIKNPIKIKQIIEPHIWHNPNNTIKMVEIINNNLIKLAPNNKNIYSQNTKKVIQEMNQIDNWIKKRLDTIPAKNRKLITANAAMIYYVKAYNIPYSVNLAKVKNMQKLTYTEVENFAMDIQKANVPTIFADTTTNSNLLESLAREANVKVFKRPLYINGLGAAGTDGDTYQKMMAANTRIIVEGLGGTYLKFEPY
ncbi:zinc ABC transporter substrate-binding protein [Dolichospermum planctonicum UHCC 0167]|uniref:metal ABC transporter solute-binding protein, Zn/Mn family n=1 Tax=Dolichospermum planctonicum TaxID=136072 RepID=UPI0015801B80|nr:zinc ABC transporter substrate-binding protein [Dolichospermum planctonicum]MCW9680591.1 zinc ABC transporter substrate-binding protein [Dolichospermum planctonicum UHCC 0167]